MLGWLESYCHHGMGIKNHSCMSQVGTLNYMSPEAILGGATNIRGGPPMKVRHQSGNSASNT
jgi:hypothetical protein